MSLKYGMYQQQSAKMHMTPQLRQALKILQLPTPELLDHIKQELQENPLLEYPGTGWDAAQHTSYSAGTARVDPLHRAAWNDNSLEKHLKEQVHFVKNVPHDIHSIINYMIGNLDTNGYLEPSLDEISKALQTEKEDTEQALNILQSFDPEGIGARNLQECLLLQAVRVADCPALVPSLISKHLQEIAGGNLRKLAASLQAPLQDVQAAVDFIKGLNPRPGAAFGPGEIKYIVPDVTVTKDGGIRINDRAAPRLTVSEHYTQMLKENGGCEVTRSFLSAKLHSAQFMIKCIEQRRQTLLRVSQAIMEEQGEFLQGGVSRLKPLTLNRVAEKVSLHESTVSRAASGKYAQTPWGVYELKLFFPSGIGTDSGEEASAHTVKAKIKECVDTEDPQNPFSDRMLTELLVNEGVRISRRTVAKYREELGIAASARRKQL